MLRKRTSETDPGDWFAFAEDRLRAADLIWSAEGITHSGIECLQEAVERYLKGYLVANGWSVVKTHDLTRLIKEACSYDAAFNKFDLLAEKLTEEFFLQHYPGLDTTDLGKDYETLRRGAQELIIYIQGALPRFFPPA